MDEQTKEKINLEISKIDSLVSKSSVLLNKCKDLKAPLKEYLGFRHVFRHSYGYELDWERFNPLFSSLEENWKKVKECFVKFIV